MAVHIRLSRRGAKKVPRYRVIVSDHRSRRDGAFIENIGHFDPSDSTGQFVINQERLAYWTGKGAKVSHTVGLLVKRHVAVQAAKS